MTLEKLLEFEAEIRKVIPKFEIRFKDESKLQKFLGLLVWLFNREYMTRYTTTLYPVVWFPSRAFYESRPKVSFTILAHELVHLLDTQKHPFWFRVSYLFPQVLALPAFLAIIPTAIVAGLWALLPLGIALVLLAPWPAPWRSFWEYRGYGMNLAVFQWSSSVAMEEMRDAIAGHFVTAGYYFMCWSRQTATAKLTEYVTAAREGALQQQEPYKQVYEFLSSNRLTTQ